VRCHAVEIDCLQVYADKRGSPHRLLTLGVDVKKVSLRTVMQMNYRAAHSRPQEICCQLVDQRNVASDYNELRVLISRTLRAGQPTKLSIARWLPVPSNHVVLLMSRCTRLVSRVTSNAFAASVWIKLLLRLNRVKLLKHGVKPSASTILHRLSSMFSNPCMFAESIPAIPAVSQMPRKVGTRNFFDPR